MDRKQEAVKFALDALSAVCDHCHDSNKPEHPRTGTPCGGPNSVVGMENPRGSVMPLAVWTPLRRDQVHTFRGTAKHHRV